MYDAINVANYIINYSNAIQSPISNLKLQKLLYYVQAAILVENGEKCFKEPIIAWEYGPVVVPIYHKFSSYGRADIPDQKEEEIMFFDSESMSIEFKTSEKIETRCREIIDHVIDAYKEVSNPFELVLKTHQEGPWMNTAINHEIDCNYILKYYTDNKDKIYNK